MSDPIDIKAVDEYLKGGSDVSQRYRELGREGVPQELDRRVLAEARAAVAGGGAARSRSWLRWSAPVALAASVVLVVAVVIESPVQDDTLAIQPASEVSYAEESKLLEETAQARQPEPEMQPEQPSASAAAPPAAPPPASASKVERKRADNAAVDSAEAQLAAERPAPSVRTQSTAARSEVDREAGLADSSAKVTESVVQEVAVTGNRQRRTAGRTAGPRNTISSSAVRTETRPAADADTEQAEPAKLLEEIRDLRRAGKTAEADLAWERFREQFPSFPVAEDDLARKKL